MGSDLSLADWIAHRRLTISPVMADIIVNAVREYERELAERRAAINDTHALRKERDALRARVYVLKDALRDCHLHLREIYNNVSENDEEGALIERARAALEEK